MNIVLIGFMGSGKTAVGRRLAAELQLDLLDTDELIEKTEGRTIGQIFATDGEEYFRDLESEVLKTLQDYDHFVLSTGGGMVLRTENVARLKSLGPVILLWADPERIWHRIKHEAHRPLLKVADPEQEIVRRLAAREPFYRQAADQIVDTSKLDVAQVSEEIEKWLKSKST